MCDFCVVTGVVRTNPEEAPVTVIFPQPQNCSAKKKPEEEGKGDDDNSPTIFPENINM